MKIGYLGIDVSKGYADFALLSAGKKVLEDSFELDDTQAGHVKLLNLLEGFKEQHDLVGILAALESTGGYENNWLTLLKNEGPGVGVRIARLNPFGVKHDSHAGLERTVTDATSARRIAIYLINHPEKANWEEPGYDVMDSLRSMYKFIRTKVKQKVQLQNQFEKLLYTAFPEMLSYMKEQLPKWLLMVLEQYPTAAAMREASMEDLIKIGHINEDKAMTLSHKAEQSIAWADNPALRKLISTYALDLLRLITQVEELKKDLEKQKEITREIEILESFQGIGRYSAIGLMIEIEDIQRFASTKKISSFFGVHPKFKQSGDKVIGVRMSKQGSSEVRAILYMVAKSALVYNPHIRQIYDRFKSQGMAHNEAMGVIMHKILRIIYGMLKSGSDYQPAYDLEKQQKTIEFINQKRQQNKKDGRNRYQQMDDEAPISKRQQRKRKEQSSSPSS
jgi:transposase